MRKNKEADKAYQAKYYQENKDRLTKTTSAEVKNRYASKKYSRISAGCIPKEKGELFKAKVKANGDSISKVIEKAIDEYLSEG